MNETVFAGNWITNDKFARLAPVNVFHRQLERIDIPAKAPADRHILFRKRFAAGKGRARLRISADDCYKLYINGVFVCQGPAPGYPFHYYYNTVDVTAYLAEGENTLAVHTYYQGLINRVWVSGDDRHGLILDLEQDGRIILSSDESFLTAVHTGFESIGRYGYDTQFAQRYISGTLQEGFEKKEYDDSGWEHAKKREIADWRMYPQPTRTLAYETIMPVLARDAGGITADFGGMYVGTITARAKGKKGDRILLTFAQELDSDGSLRHALRANCDYREEWLLSGGEDALNEYDYKSFRYARLEVPEGCEVSGITLAARHYPFRLKAVPDVTDPALLRIWDLCADTLKYGAQEVIQDCMEREKGNYLGDGCYTALAYTVLTGDAALFKKLIDDSLRSSFIDRGLMTCACCSMMQEIAEYPLMMYFALYSYYRFSGDREYLAEKYDQLTDILDCYRERYMDKDGLLAGLDKWCVVEWPKEYRDGYAADVEEGKVCHEAHNVINAHFIGAVRYMNKISSLLGRQPYCDEKPFVDSYIRAFYDNERKLFRDVKGNDHISLISNVFPLMYGICPDRETEGSIVDLIKERGFTTVMLFGAFPILYGLKRTGRKDMLLDCLKDEGAWLRMLREGATRTFEGWGKDSKWNTSLFHLTLSYAALFLTEWENY